MRGCEGMEMADNENKHPWNPADGGADSWEHEASVAGMLWMLPWCGGKWTPEQRKRWFIAFNAVIDMQYPESIDGYQKVSPPLPEPIKAEVKTAIVVAPPSPAIAKKPDQKQPTIFKASVGVALGTAKVMVKKMKSAKFSAHVWYSKDSGTTRLCAENYAPAADDVLVGVYDAAVKPEDLAHDLRTVYISHGA